MTSLKKAPLTVVCLLCATAAWSADYKVKRSLDLPTSPTETWHLIGDFCDIDDWHPEVRACSLKVVEGRLVRVLTTNAGDEITQQRIAQEAGLSYTYRTVSSSLPIENFTATLSIEPFGNSRVEWSANFTSDDPEMEQYVVDEIEAGLAAIESLLVPQ